MSGGVDTYVCAHSIAGLFRVFNMQKKVCTELGCSGDWAQLGTRPDGHGMAGVTEQLFQCNGTCDQLAIAFKVSGASAADTAAPPARLESTYKVNEVEAAAMRMLNKFPGEQPGPGRPAAGKPPGKPRGRPKSSKTKNKTTTPTTAAVAAATTTTQQEQTSNKPAESTNKPAGDVDHVAAVALLKQVREVSEAAKKRKAATGDAAMGKAARGEGQAPTAAAEKPKETSPNATRADSDSDSGSDSDAEPYAMGLKRARAPCQAHCPC